MTRKLMLTFFALACTALAGPALAAPMHHDPGASALNHEEMLTSGPTSAAGAIDHTRAGLAALGDRPADGFTAIRDCSTTSSVTGLMRAGVT